MEITLLAPENFSKQHLTLSDTFSTNSNGTNRQSILKKCRIGEKLLLKRELNHPTDKWAIAVFTLTGDQLGYLPSSNDNYLATLIDKGFTLDVKIINLKGGKSFLDKLFNNEGQPFTCLIEVIKGNANWELLTPFLNENSEIDALEKRTRSLKRKSLIESNYKEIIRRIIELDNKGLHARACRTARIPIKDYSQFLEDEGRLKESLEIIEWYLSYNEYYSPLATHLRDIENRKKRIISKLGK